MFDEILNIELVQRTRESKGIKTIWLVKQCGLSRTTGYIMFRTGLLPADETLRKSVLTRLSQLLGIDQRQLIVPPRKVRVSA